MFQLELIRHRMYIVPIAWIYVALMMSVAEATNSNGTVLGGIMTFVLYGVLPVAVVVYVMGAPARRKAIKAREQAQLAQWREAQAAANAASPAASSEPDASGLPPRAAEAATVAPVRKEE